MAALSTVMSIANARTYTHTHTHAVIMIIIHMVYHIKGGMNLLSGGRLALDALASAPPSSSTVKEKVRMRVS